MTSGRAVAADPADAAEQSVLGALLLDAGTAWPLCAAAGLRATDFADRQHAAIFGAVALLVQRGQAVDSLLVCQALAELGLQVGADPMPVLVGLEVSVATARNAGLHAELVVRRARLRRVHAAATAVARAAADAAASDETLQSLLADLTEQAKAGLPRAAALPVTWAAEIGADVQLPQQLVEGLLTAGGLSSVNGHPNAGKSYFAGALALAVASGLDFLGRRVQQVPVVYIAAEGAASMLARFQADARFHKRQPGHLALVAQGVTLLEPSADVDALVATCDAVRARTGAPVGLIVIDTVARVMVGGDENTAVDMGRLIAAADRLKATTGAHVLLLHHVGKDASKGARGHSSLRAALDTEIEVSVDDSTRLHTAKVTKQRDLASKGDTLHFRLVPVPLGVDQWGGEVTACAVVHEPGSADPQRPARLTPCQQAVLAYLAGKAAGVRRRAMVEELERQGQARASVYRAIGGLLNAGMLVDVAGQVYLPREGAQ